MDLTICYITGRREPHLDWMLDELLAQRQPGDRISLVAIDFYGRGQDELGVRPDHLLEHTILSKPKPTIWQGEHRVTRDHWWAKSSAANTALCLAPTDYVAFLDDRCHLGPSWLAAARRGYHERQSVLLGTYIKIEDEHVGEARADKIGRDNRLAVAPQGLIGCPGGWLYGSVFALPLAWALQVNGFEEALDGHSFEDVIFGYMLANAGFRCDFAPDLAVVQDRRGGVTDSHASAFKRTDKGPEPANLAQPSPPWDKSHAALDRFGKARRTDPAYTPDLTELRARIRAGESFPIPDPERVWMDWYICDCGCSPRASETKMHGFVSPRPSSGPKPRAVNEDLDRADSAKQEGMPWRAL